MAENLEKLPGLSNIISDGGLVVPPKNPLLNSSVLIIGFANNGPVNTPVSIVDASKAFSQTESGAIDSNTLFGNLTDNARLSASYYECAAANFGAAPDIRVMRLGLPTPTNDDSNSRGDGRAVGYLMAGSAKAIRLMGKWAGTLYHKVSVTTTTDTLTISFGDNQSETFSLGAAGGLSALVLSINASEIASKYVIAELITDTQATLNTATSTGNVKLPLGLGENWTSIENANLIQYISPSIVTGTDAGSHVAPLASFASTGATVNEINVSELTVGDGTYNAYVGDTGGAIVPTTVFVPKYVKYNRKYHNNAAAVNNPFPADMALGALSLPATAESSKMGADDSSVVDSGTAQTVTSDNLALTSDTRELRTTLLGGIRVQEIHRIVSSEEDFAGDNPTDTYLTGVTDTGTHTITDNIILSDEVTSTKNNFFLSNLSSASNTTLIIDMSVDDPMPGGFYMGVSAALTGSNTDVECHVYDVTTGGGTWTELDVDDATANMTLSGFIGITQTGLLAKIYASPLLTTGLVRYAITVTSSTAGSAGKISSIIPVVAQSYDVPVWGAESGRGGGGVSVHRRFNVAGSKGHDGTIHTKSPATFTSKPTPGQVGAMDADPSSAYIYGNVLINSLWSPTMITMRVAPGASNVIINTSYTQVINTASALYKPNLSNKIVYNSSMNGDSVLQTSEALNGFGFEDLTAFSSRIVTNGLQEVWGYAYVDVPFTGEDSFFTNLVDSSGVVTTANMGGYLEYDWRVKFLGASTGPASIDATGNTGNLGTSQMNGFPGTDWSNMSMSRKRQALNAALGLIEGYECDIYVLSQMYLDDTSSDEAGSLYVGGFHTELHSYLVRSINRNHEAVGVISVKPFDKKTPSLNAVDIARHYGYLTDGASGGNSAAGIMAAFQATFGCMSVVAGEPLFNTGFGPAGYSGTSESAYAGLLAAIPVAESTTNKRVGGVSGLRYNFLREQQEILMRNRFAVLGKKTSTSSVQVVDGVTAAKNNGQADRSDFVRISTVRVTFELLQAVRAVAEPYIGRPNAPWAHNQLKFDVQKVIDDFKDANYIVDGSARIKADLTDRVNGNVFIELVLVPPLEIRRIIVTTSLRPSLDQ